MRYSKFEFKNYKGIRELTLPLGSSVATLIGLNESGKTTILEAIFSFSYGSEALDAINPGLANLRDPNSWIPIPKKFNFNEDITITATVELDDADQSAYAEHMSSKFGLSTTNCPTSITINEIHHFENSRHTGTTRTWSLVVQGTKGQQRNSRTYRSKTDEWTGAVGLLKARLPRIWYFPNFLFDLPDAFVLSSSTDVVSGNAERDEFYRVTFEQILQSIDSKMTLDEHIVKRYASIEDVDRRNLDATIHALQQALNKAIFAAWKRIFSKAIEPQEVALQLRRGPAGETLLDLKIHDNDGYYELNERSLGFRWFFMFLLMTSFRTGNDAASKPFFLLDEPASNLHSSAQRQLLKSFETLADNCRLIYTTHSQHLIDLKWLDSAFVVRNEAISAPDSEEYFESRVTEGTAISAEHYRKFAALHPNQTSYLQPVLDLLEFRPSDLEAAPGAVIVEGKSDFAVLKYAAEILNLGTDLRIIPGTGASALDPLIRLHLGWGSPFAVLLDGDKEGKHQAERYRETYGPVVDAVICTLPVLVDDSSVEEIEDLVSEVDQLALLQAIGGVPDAGKVKKKDLHNALHELYATKTIVVLSTETTNRLSKVLTALSDKVKSVGST